MLNRKLLEVLQRLSDPERSKLRLFLQSPYFNHKHNAADLLHLYEYIIARDAEEQHPELSKKTVAGLFFPAKVYQEGKKGPLDGLASDLFNMVKQFMTQASFEAEDTVFEEGITMAKFYRRYGMEDRFWQSIQSLRKALKERQNWDALFFQKQFKIEFEAASFESLNNSFENDDYMKAADENLDMEYAINKLEFACLLSHRKKATALDFNEQNPLIQAVLKLPETYYQIPLFQIYHVIFQLLQEPGDEEVFSKLEQLLETQKSSIPFAKYRELKAYYRYFWGRRYLKSGDAAARHKMFEVYKEHFEAGYFYEENAIMINPLRVLVFFGLKLGQFDWVKKVLEEHPPQRIWGTKYPVEAHSICLAEYYFYKKEYTIALETLVYKHFENPLLSIQSDVLLIKIYFECSDDLLDYRMKALEQKVRRTNLSTEWKSRYYSFLQKLDKIVKHGWKKDALKHNQLLEEIKSTQGIVEREWLLEKLNDALSK